MKRAVIVLLTLAFAASMALECPKQFVGEDDRHCNFVFDGVGPFPWKAESPVILPGGRAVSAGGELFHFLWLHCLSSAPKLSLHSLFNCCAVAFRVWAEHASSVAVQGTFGSVAMAKDGTPGSWTANVASAKIGDYYCFH